MRSAFWLPAAIAIATSAVATEVTVQNDSLMAGDNGAIQAGFVAGEKAAAWLTSPCDGNIVAAQIYWQSLNGNTTDEIEDSIDIYRSDAYPEPGALAEQILGPVLSDGFINEYRYLDEDNTIPLSVPVVQDETFVVALTFLQAPDPTQGPSVVNDLDGIQPNSNAIYASLGGGQFAWFPNSTLGVFGDWVIRAVVSCGAVSNEADVGVNMVANSTQYTAGEPLTYTITVTNAGPAAANSTTLVDAFPAAFTGASWICTVQGGASCPSAGNGAVLADIVSLPAGGAVVYTVTGVVAPGTTGTLTNSATAVVGLPATDPDASNNTDSFDANPAPPDDTIFANGFDPSG